MPIIVEGSGIYSLDTNPNANSEYGIYGVNISSMPGNASTVNIVARLPESFTMGITSTWEAPIPGMVGAVAGNLAGAAASAAASIPGALGAAVRAATAVAGPLAQLSGFGASPKTQKMSTLLWQDTSPIEFSLPIIFTAETDARMDVMVPVAELIRLSAPIAVGPVGMLMSPGPNILREFSGGIRVRLGKFFDCNNCIVTASNVEFDTKPTANGALTYARVDISITTAVVPTQDDIIKWFMLDGYISKTNLSTADLIDAAKNKARDALNGLINLF